MKHTEILERRIRLKVQKILNKSSNYYSLQQFNRPFNKLVKDGDIQSFSIIDDFNNPFCPRLKYTLPKEFNSKTIYVMLDWLDWL